MRRLFIFGAALAAMLPVQAAPPAIQPLTSVNIKTLTLDSHVVTENRAELEKIGKNFAQAYRVHNISMAYQQPGKLHLETKVLNAAIAYTINGNKRYTSIPAMRIHKVEDIGTSPGKKQTLLDFGLLPPEQLDDYNAKFLRQEGALLVYELTAKQASETFKDIVWLDSKTHITAKRQHFDRHGLLVATYLCKNPLQVRPHIFVPTRIEVYNPDGKLAGATAYTNIKANLSIDPALFTF